jgi:predicted deacylase
VAGFGDRAAARDRVSARHFAQSYAEARGKFLAAAGACGLAVERHAHPSARGHAGEELSMDCALLGAPDATRLLILSSGTHGVEGFCGSGAQVSLLNDPDFLRRVNDDGTTLVLIHAVNPYGFSHWGRTNEDNVDLNRNFVDHAKPHPANPAYAEVHPLLASAEWPPSAQNEAKIQRYIDERGLPAFQQAVSGGQYEHPEGLFFGGRERTWSNRTIRGILRRWRAATRVAWIDFHTGLGPCGHGEIIHSGRDDEADHARAVAAWGERVKSIYKGTSVSARLEGVLAFAIYDEIPGARFAGCAIEYGTLPMLQVLQGLRAENWLRRNPGAPSELRERLRRQTRDAFYCDTDDWKAKVVEQAREAALQALAALGREAP